jgi:hypothetical protein
LKVDATCLHGSDFIRLDPSNKHARLDVNSIFKDQSGAVISFKYSGILNLTSGVVAVFEGNPDAVTTNFGDACESCFYCEWKWLITIVTHVLLETGSEYLRTLEQKVYVGSGRFIIEAGKPPTVEYLISEVS